MDRLTIANPLKFLRLFQGNKNLPRAAGTLALGAAIQCFAEAKNLSNVNQIYNSANVGMSTAMQSNFLTGMGIAMVLAGRLASYSIAALGSRCEADPHNLMVIAAIPRICLLLRLTYARLGSRLYCCAGGTLQRAM